MNQSPSFSHIIEAEPQPGSLTHISLFDVSRLRLTRTFCKIASALVISAALFFITTYHSGPNVWKVSWGAAPLLVLGMIDAAALAEGRRLAQLAMAHSADSEGTSDQAMKLFLAEAKGLSYGDALKNLSGLLSVSVWPYYATLVGLFVVATHQMSQSTEEKQKVPSAVTPMLSSNPVMHLPVSTGKPMAAVSPRSMDVRPQPMSLPPQLQARLQQQSRAGLPITGGAPVVVPPAGGALVGGKPATAVSPPSPSPSASVVRPQVTSGTLTLPPVVPASHAAAPAASAPAAAPSASPSSETSASAAPQSSN